MWAHTYAGVAIGKMWDISAGRRVRKS